MRDVSTLFELFAAGPRRRLLVTLCDVDSVDVSNGLSTRSVAASEPSSTYRPTGGDDRKVQLYHAHLPKLEAAGVIEWDRETETVSRGPQFSAVEPVVRLLAENEHVLPGSFF